MSPSRTILVALLIAIELTCLVALAGTILAAVLR